MATRRVPKNKPKSAAVLNGAVHPPSQHVERFPMRFSGLTGLFARAFAIDQRHAYVDVSDQLFTARYGPWVVSTELANIATASISGPYAVGKVIGPPRLSLVDRGLTFATNNDRGVCITFREPVAGMVPTARFRHPGLTVTVDDPEGLIAAIAS